MHQGNQQDLEKDNFEFKSWIPDGILQPRFGNLCNDTGASSSLVILLVNVHREKKKYLQRGKKMFFFIPATKTKAEI